MNRNLQLTAYHFAYTTIFGRTPTVEVVALVKTKQPKIQRITASRTTEDHAWYRSVVVNVVRGIRHQAFPPNPGWACGECIYAEACKAWR